MKKPLIAINPLVDEERESYWMLPGYFRGILQAGGIPVMLPSLSESADLEALADAFDGFLFPGGQDVAPELYGAEVLPHCGPRCPERDEMEAAFLPLVRRRGKAVLGICRGLQFFNVALGGTLYQDLPTEHPSGLVHSQDRPYDAPSHAVQLLPGTPLQQLAGRDSAQVNSCHHQGIKALAPALRPMAVAEDGLIEAVYDPDARFFWAVQWHPEFSQAVDPLSQAIFEAFVCGCRG